MPDVEDTGTLTRKHRGRTTNRSKRKEFHNLPGGQTKSGKELRTSNVCNANFGIRMIVGRVRGKIDSVAVEARSLEDDGSEVLLDDWKYDKAGKPIQPADIQEWLGEITRQCSELFATEARRAIKVES